MPFGRVTFLVFILLALPAFAEPMELLVRSYPPEAKMRDQFGNDLGRTGRPTTIDWSRDKGSLQLQLSKEGHRSVTRTLSFREIDHGVYPEDGEVRLPALSFAVTIKDTLLYRKKAVGLSLLVLSTVLGVMISRLKKRDGVARKSERVGDYQILEQIGHGSTADVFRAASVNDPESLPVALKLMKDTPSLDGQSGERFRQEIKTSLGLKHTNLVKIYDWGEHQNGRLYLVTELLEGRTLRQELSKKEETNLTLVCDVLRALGGSLDYLHGRGLVHRDIKPENVFLTNRGEIKLMDLGLTKGDDIAPMTAVGTAMGTPHYMAPEQIRGKAVPASDQYSLGVLAFEMLTGTRPYRGEDGLKILNQHLTDPVPRVSQFRNLGPMVDDAVAMAMDKNAESRFEDVQRMVDSLCSALMNDPDVDAETSAFEGF